MTISEYEALVSNIISYTVEECQNDKPCIDAVDGIGASENAGATAWKTTVEALIVENKTKTEALESGLTKHETIITGIENVGNNMMTKVEDAGGLLHAKIAVLEDLEVDTRTKTGDALEETRVNILECESVYIDLTTKLNTKWKELEE